MRCLRHSAGLVHTPLVSKCRWSRDGEGTLRATYEELMRCAGRDRVRCGRRGAHPAGRPASASPGRAVSGGWGTELESHQDNLRAERPLAFHTRFLLIPLIRVAVVFFLNEKPSLRPAWGAWRSFRELGAGLRGADVAPGLAEPLREREEAGGAGARPDFGSRTCRTGRCASRAAHPRSVFCSLADDAVSVDGTVTPFCPKTARASPRSPGTDGGPRPGPASTTLPPGGGFRAQVRLPGPRERGRRLEGPERRDRRTRASGDSAEHRPQTTPDASVARRPPAVTTAAPRAGPAPPGMCSAGLVTAVQEAVGAGGSARHSQAEDAVT